MSTPAMNDEFPHQPYFATG